MRTTFRALTRFSRLTVGGALTALLFTLPVLAISDDLKPAAKQDNAARLGYHFKEGETTRYRVTGFFDGRIPPFVQAGGPPAHLHITLDFAVHVDKQNTDGADVSFHVEKAGLLLLDEAAGADGKLPPPDKQIEFPIALDQIQSALDVKATLKSDGTIVNVTGGDANSQKINLGIELRKLFLLLLPVAFPDNPVKPGDTWTFDDGLLGKNPAKTKYTASLTSLKMGRKDTLFQCNEKADTVFDELRDKDGKVTLAPSDAVETSAGNASFNGDFTFSAPNKADAAADRSTGRLQEGHFTLSAVLNKKRTIPDPANPDAPLDTHVDVTARLTVQPITKK